MYTSFAVLSENITLMSSAEPAPLSALVSLWQARAALQDGDAGRAAKLAQEGLGFLENYGRAASVAKSPARYVGPLTAALNAIAATAGKRSGEEASRAQETFEAADLMFRNLESSPDQASAAPFLRDYLGMLAEFGQIQKVLHAVQKVTSEAQALAARNQNRVPILWLTAAMLPPTPNLIAEMGSALIEEGDNQAALEAFLHAAALALARGEFPAALHAANRAVATFPDNAEALRLLGVLKWRSGDVKAAGSDFAAAVKANPEDRESRLALACASLVLRTEDTLEQLKVVISSAGQHPEALWLRAVAQLEIASANEEESEHDIAKSCREGALADLNKALEQGNKHAAWRRTRALALYELYQYDSALKDLDESLGEEPDDIDARGLRASVLLRLGRCAEALADINTALPQAKTRSVTKVKHAWLLSVKGEALIKNQWADQALEVLQKATEFDPAREAYVRLFLQALREKKDWTGLARTAGDFQTRNYREAFLLELRREEIIGLRNAGDFEAALMAFRRPSASPRPDVKRLWLYARLLADIGDFEAADDNLPDECSIASEEADLLSLRGWIVQNLEARDPEHRVALGREGHRLYEAALETARKKAGSTDAVWLSKGVANALLRFDPVAANEKYHEVIDACQQRLRTSSPNARIFCLMGWCYHGMGQNSAATRYYHAGSELGEKSPAVDFDYALVLCAAQETGPDSLSALQRYKRTIEALRKEPNLRRLGLVRVALHDLRELLFRKPELPGSGEIMQSLCMELLRCITEFPPELEGFAERLYVVLDLATSGPLDLPAPEQEALRARIKGLQMQQMGEIQHALQLLRAAAQSYSRIGNKPCAASAWRDLALAANEGGNYEIAGSAAGTSLQEGLYEFEPQEAYPLLALLALLARYALPEREKREGYRQLLVELFNNVGPEFAYLDAQKIVQTMHPEEHRLFAETVLRTFPFSASDKWLFVKGVDNPIPNNDSTLAPFVAYMAPMSFKDVSAAANQAG